MTSGPLNSREEWITWMRAHMWSNPNYTPPAHDGPRSDEFPVIIVTGYDWHYGRECVEAQISRKDFAPYPACGTSPLAEMIAIQSDPTGKGLWDALVENPDDMNQIGVFADWCKEQGHVNIEYELRKALDQGYLDLIASP